MGQRQNKHHMPTTDRPPGACDNSVVRVVWGRKEGSEWEKSRNRKMLKVTQTQKYLLYNHKTNKI